MLNKKKVLFSIITTCFLFLMLIMSVTNPSLIHDKPILSKRPLSIFLAKWNNAENLEISSMSGALFETYVVSEIIKSFLNTGKKPSLYFNRDQNQREIDLLLIENGEVYPIEIKKNYYPNKESTKHFHLAAMIGKIKNGLVICQAEEILPIPNSNNFLIPLRYL